MLDDVLTRIDKRLRAVNLSATAASRKAGLSEDAIRNLRRAVNEGKRQGVSTRTIAALAPVLHTSTGWLLDGIGSEADFAVPIVGRAGADAEGRIAYADGHDTGDSAPLPPGGSANAVAVEIAGHSMRGWIEDGSLIYYEETRDPPTDDMLGSIVVVGLDTGEVLVKRLLRGSVDGLFDLESVSGPTRRDARVLWAADVTAVIPPKQAQKIIRRGHA
jgi:SOS-response transcriptional repressor LexA